MASAEIDCRISGQALATLAGHNTVAISIAFTSLSSHPIDVSVTAPCTLAGRVACAAAIACGGVGVSVVARLPRGSVAVAVTAPCKLAGRRACAAAIACGGVSAPGDIALFCCLHVDMPVAADSSISVRDRRVGNTTANVRRLASVCCLTMSIFTYLLCTACQT